MSDEAEDDSWEAVNDVIRRGRLRAAAGGPSTSRPIEFDDDGLPS